ncbi:MAG TPA: DUF2897 family protein [Pseudomonas xinjiangensis]|uniref:DUF2897 family protein n=2 Tax=root TaxID=1 RepID=A0A7V1FT64_9GAMM|nr:DUF2897 family protein [Halopseudomonas xinjiangensis]HEC48841.1 DUF2897 family protein [Halopseudomonas xinjiangensis]
MTTFGWIFIFIAVATLVGSLYMLLKTANKMPIDPEKMKLIKARKAEMEAKEAREKDRE